MAHLSAKKRPILRAKKRPSLTAKTRAKATAKKRPTLTATKAKKILRDGEIGGKKLTEKQRKFFGARASGQPIKRKK